MHFDHSQVSEKYTKYIKSKLLFLLVLAGVLFLSLITALSYGAVDLAIPDVLVSLFGQLDDQRTNMIVWNIRLPQALASVIAGGGLAISGVVMQSILRNPLGSPYTLGISHAAAFGAAFSVMVLGSGVMSSVGSISLTNPYITTASAFFFSLLAAAIIVSVACLRRGTPEVMVLSGVALGALFTAGTMFLQFFADDMQLAAMVFWTFGDTARATWNEIYISAIVLVICFLYFTANSWNYNAIEVGEETALGLGIRVNRIRMIGMLFASILTAVLISFLGVIGFVGLVVPHMVRKVIGSDHRFLLPASLFAGAILLLLSDLVARMILAPHVLPVSVLTAFLGAPMFFWLILRGNR
ncbi:MAG: iron ABC transporter permease [Desulfotalea sp.]